MAIFRLCIGDVLVSLLVAHETYLVVGSHKTWFNEDGIPLCYALRLNIIVVGISTPQNVYINKVGIRGCRAAPRLCENCILVLKTLFNFHDSPLAIVFSLFSQ